MQPVNEIRFGGFWVRFAASVIDGLLIDGVSAALLWLALAVYGVEAQELTGTTRQVLGVVGTFFVALPYYSLGHYRWGRTLGKKAFGLRVVNASTLGRLTLKQALGRTAALPLSYAVGMLGFVIAAWDSKKRSLHDRLAGTVVIRDL